MRRGDELGAALMADKVVSLIDGHEGVLVGDAGLRRWAGGRGGSGSRRGVHRGVGAVRDETPPRAS